MKAYLNGTELKADACRLDDINITYRKRRIADYAGSIEFYGWAYDLIKSELIDDEKGYLKSLSFRVERTCCGDGIVFNGAVRGDKLDWDSESCIVSADIVQEDDTTSAYRKLESKTITDGLSETGHPYIWGANGKNAFAVYFSVVLRIGLTVIISTIRAILAAIEFLLGDRSDLYEKFDEFISEMDNQILLGIGQWLNMPLCREIINQGITPEGLALNSSILNQSSSPYYNLAYLSIQSEAESVLKKTKGSILKKNLPVQSISRFLDDLAGLFNADWVVIDGVLHFERRDSLPDSVAFDISGQQDLYISFEWQKDPKRAYFDLQYSPDSTERGGYEAANFFNHIEEWNAAANESQQGAFEVLPPFSPYLLDIPYGSKLKASVVSAFLAVYGTFFKVGEPTLNITENLVYVPKLVPVIKTATGWKADDGSQMHGENIYNNFWSIEDPNNSGFRGLQFNAEFTADCSFLDLAAILTTVFVPIGNNTAVGYVKSIDVDYTSNTVKIQGEL